MILLLVYLCMTVGGMALFKLGSSDLLVQATKHTFGLQISYLSLLGLICYGCSFLLWLWILKSQQISFIFPIMNSLAIVLTAAFGMLVLGESVSVLKIVGILIILAGVLCVSLSR